jgi:hypothetical protein
MIKEQWFVKRYFNMGMDEFASLIVSGLPDSMRVDIQKALFGSVQPRRLDYDLLHHQGTIGHLRQARYNCTLYNSTYLPPAINDLEDVIARLERTSIGVPSVERVRMTAFSQQDSHFTELPGEEEVASSTWTPIDPTVTYNPQVLEWRTAIPTSGLQLTTSPVESSPPARDASNDSDISWCGLASSSTDLVFVGPPDLLTSPAGSGEWTWIHRASPSDNPVHAIRSPSPRHPFSADWPSPPPGDLQAIFGVSAFLVWA